jgi:uncharacterized protein (UPF0548 family)
VFRISKPTDREIERKVLKASTAADLGGEYLDPSGGFRAAALPNGFVIDRLSTQIGDGREGFKLAIRAFHTWTQFDLGWVRVANALSPIEVGRVIAVEVRSFGLWSLNLSRIVSVIQTENRFGFIYKTTSEHVEEGEERFEVMLDPSSGNVWYETEAVSRPSDWMALLGYPVTRAFQHRFARDSHRRMRDAVR